MEYLFIIFVFVAVTAWWFKHRAARETVSKQDTVDTSPLSEQELVRLQADFEHRLAADSELPDSIRGRDAYIYWNHMCKWFNSLIAAHRYDDEYTKKLRHDWRNYIDLLPRAKTARFLALETDDEAKASTYGQEAELASRSIELIQNAFAAAIGADAIEELRDVRSRDVGAFDRTGQRPMAPMGHHYFPISLSPYIEECQPMLSDLPRSKNGDAPFITK